MHEAGAMCFCLFVCLFFGILGNFFQHEQNISLEIKLSTQLPYLTQEKE